MNLFKVLRFLWLFSICALWAFLAAIYDRLPEHLAVHFDFSGNPNGWSSRSEMILIMLATSLLVNGLQVGIGISLPRIPEKHLNIRNKSYWLSTQELREKMYSRIRTKLAGGAFFSNLVLLGAAYYILRKNG